MLKTVYINQYYEKNITTSEETSHYFLGGRQIAYKKGSTLEYVHPDHLGSTSVTTNASGAEVSTVKYFPFGGTRSTTGTVETDKLFTGQRLDETGLYFYNARYYDATIGRFISPDTIVPSPMNPQSLNRYSYCLNNPLKYTDPSGHGENPIADYVKSLGMNFDDTITTAAALHGMLPEGYTLSSAAQAAVAFWGVNTLLDNPDADLPSTVVDVLAQGCINGNILPGSAYDAAMGNSVIRHTVRDYWEDAVPRAIFLDQQEDLLYGRKVNLSGANLDAINDSIGFQAYADYDNLYPSPNKWVGLVVTAGACMLIPGPFDDGFVVAYFAKSAGEITIKVTANVTASTITKATANTLVKSYISGKIQNLATGTTIGGEISGWVISSW